VVAFGTGEWARGIVARLIKGSSYASISPDIEVVNYNGTTDSFIIQPEYRPALPNPLPDRLEILGKLFASQGA